MVDDSFLFYKFHFFAHEFWRILSVLITSGALFGSKPKVKKAPEAARSDWSKQNAEAVPSEGSAQNSLAPPFSTINCKPQPNLRPHHNLKTPLTLNLTLTLNLRLN